MADNMVKMWVGKNGHFCCADCSYTVKTKPIHLDYDLHGAFPCCGSTKHCQAGKGAWKTIPFQEYKFWGHQKWLQDWTPKNFYAVDFGPVDWSLMDLTGCDLSGCDLRQAILPPDYKVYAGSKWKGTKLIQSELPPAVMNLRVLGDADFTGEDAVLKAAEGFVIAPPSSPEQLNKVAKTLKAKWENSAQGVVVKWHMDALKLKAVTGPSILCSCCGQPTEHLEKSAAGVVPFACCGDKEHCYSSPDTKGAKWEQLNEYSGQVAVWKSAGFDQHINVNWKQAPAVEKTVLSAPVNPHAAFLAAHNCGTCGKESKHLETPKDKATLGYTCCGDKQCCSLTAWVLAASDFNGKCITHNKLTNAAESVPYKAPVAVPVVAFDIETTPVDPVSVTVKKVVNKAVQKGIGTETEDLPPCTECHKPSKHVEKVGVSGLYPCCGSEKCCMAGNTAKIVPTKVEKPAVVVKTLWSDDWKTL